MQVHDLPDITPNGQATPLSATPIFAVWVDLGPNEGNAGDIRYGGSTVSATRGSRLQHGALTPHTIPRCDFNQGAYDLSKIFVFGTGSDSVSISYGV